MEGDVKCSIRYVPMDDTTCEVQQGEGYLKAGGESEPT